MVTRVSRAVVALGRSRLHGGLHNSCYAAAVPQLRFMSAAAAADAGVTATSTVTAVLQNTAAAIESTPLAAVSQAAAQVVGKSNGTPIPGIPFDARYPDFNLVVSSLEDGTARYSLQLLDYVHSLGFEWWSAAALSTLGLRLVIGLPAFITSVKTGAKFQQHQESLGKFTDMLKVARERQDNALLTKAGQEYRKFMADNGLKMRNMFLPMLLQIYPFYNLFQGLRSFSSQAHLIPGAASAVPWLNGTQLIMHLPDPTFVLPAAQTALAIIAIVSNRNVAGIPQASLTPGGMRLIFGGLTTLFGFTSAFFPAILQVSFVVTSATMVFQQGLLRIKPVTNMLGFPKDWPLPPEVIAERARRRGNIDNPMMEGLKGFEPLFRLASNIAAGHWGGVPRHVYVSPLKGLRDPGAPPPPEGLPVALASTATATRVVTAAAQGAAAAASAAQAATAAAPAAATASTAAPGQSQQLFTSRPKKSAKK